jgi:hypothetical protein
MLRDTRMAEIFAALRHGFLRQRRNFGAASTRSTNLTLLVWALSCHSLHNHLTATTRDKAPFQTEPFYRPATTPA